MGSLDWFSRQLTVRTQIPVKPGISNVYDSIVTFLEAMGYRDISLRGNAIFAIRGIDRQSLQQARLEKWYLFEGNDPRKHYHETELRILLDAILVQTEIESFYALGTKHDTAVYLAEFQILAEFLRTNRLRLEPLEVAQRRRRRSDRTTLFAVILIMSWGFAAALLAVRGALL